MEDITLLEEACPLDRDREVDSEAREIASGRPLVMRRRFPTWVLAVGGLVAVLLIVRGVNHRTAVQTVQNNAVGAVEVKAEKGDKSSKDDKSDKGDKPDKGDKSDKDDDKEVDLFHDDDDTDKHDDKHHDADHKHDHDHEKDDDKDKDGDDDKDEDEDDDDKDDKDEKHKEHEKEKKEHKPRVIPDMGMGFPEREYWPTLFCWSVMNVKNAQEVATIKGQLRNRTGIFGCDNVAVLSGKRVKIGYGHTMPNGTRVPVFTWLNPAHSVPMGNLQGGDSTNSFKNADIFINAWDILVKSGAVFGHNWTAKVDPDAVFFAHRLRTHVKKYTWGTAPWYFKNCDFKGPQLYGSLEVFNERALMLYRDKGASCKRLPWGGWGEDEWIDKCMLSIGATFKIDYKLVGDHRCMSAECGAIDRVAFHDYKSEASYYNCWKQSSEAEKIKEGGYFCCVTPNMQTEKSGRCQSCVPANRQWPGQFCGNSLWGCHKCGQTAEWCRMVGKNKAIPGNGTDV